MRSYLLSVGILLSFTLPAVNADDAKWWKADVDAALQNAKDNRKELEAALNKVPAEQRPGMAFLIANMPDRDLWELKADFLLTNVDLAYQARAKTPWGKTIPEELFLNDVLPYASVTEKREPWRKEMMELCLPLVKDAKTISEAAMKLNSTVFKKLNVRYSTKRERPDQSPSQSIASGMASCTGLSIILVDACRSVGIPARLVGTPLWANKRGNHSWVEIWDKDWHFTGACEQDPNGLNRGWFVNDASKATKDSVEHAIYASSFKRTQTIFPQPWAQGRKDVFAENVTDRYAKKAETTNTRVMIRVWEAGKTKRVVVPIVVLDPTDDKKSYRGNSHGETFDTNDILTFELPRKKKFVARVGPEGKTEVQIDTADKDQLIIEVELTPATPAK